MVTLQLSIFSLLSVLAKGESTVINNALIRVPRSPSPGLLDSFPPGDKLKPVSLADFNSIKEQIKNLGGLSEKLEQAIAAEKEARSAFKNFIETAKERIASLENAVYPDEDSYWSESDSCGGVIVSQTGRISYKSELAYDNYEKCIWTVRANYRSKVKVQLNGGFDDDGHDFVAVTEVDQTGQLHTVKLGRKSKYVFQGPLLIISFVTDWGGHGTGFQLEFEGIGRNIDKKINYRHFHLTDLSGAFTSNLQETSPNSGSIVQPSGLLNVIERAANSNSGESGELSTIVLCPKFTNTSSLHVSMDQNFKFVECDKVSLTVYESFIENNSTLNRCCGAKCDRLNSINNDGMVLITILSKEKSSTDFKFTWETDTKVPHSDSVDTCGGVVSGRLGTISYKLENEYENNERCVWTIKPTGKSKVRMILQSEEFEDGYDYLLVSAIEPDFEISNTRLTRSKSYNFSGPIMFVTFYSDGNSQGKGFSLRWEEFGETLTNFSHPDPIYLDQESGTQSLCLTSPIPQVIVINPKYLDRSALNLQLTAVEPSTPILNPHRDVLPVGLYLYGNNEDNFTLARKSCDELYGDTIPEEFETTGGVFILNFRDIISQNIKLGFSWKKGASPKQLNVEGQTFASQSEGCGGILVGDAGKVEYKLLSTYENNARCTWVIESSQLSKISFKLTKDGFESCCDHLFATPMIPENGTLGESVLIDRVYKRRSFTTPVVFITFYSDGSVAGQGFSLEFTTSGDVLEKAFKFNHNLLKTASGNVSHSSGSHNDTNTISTYIFSPDAIESDIEDTNVTISIAKFGSDDACRKDSLLFAELRSPKQDKASPNTFTCNMDNETDGTLTGCECSSSDTESSMNSIFSLKERAFISIFKSYSEGNPSFQFNWTATDTVVEAVAE